MSEAALAPCPFCEAQDQGRLCARCGRDRTATRRACRKCRKFTPSAESECCHCGARYRSELLWKIPIIVVMFVAAIFFGIYLHSSMN
jgi:predicted amidophosphoribosyltransferase